MHNCVMMQLITCFCHSQYSFAASKQHRKHGSTGVDFAVFSVSRQRKDKKRKDQTVLPNRIGKRKGIARHKGKGSSVVCLSPFRKREKRPRSPKYLRENVEMSLRFSVLLLFFRNSRASETAGALSESERERENTELARRYGGSRSSARGSARRVQEEAPFAQRSRRTGELRGSRVFCFVFCFFSLSPPVQKRRSPQT